jgi:outer membrane protein assembly factor BamB
MTSVGRLAPRWTLTTAGAISTTPTVDDGAVYVPDYGGKLWVVAAGGRRVLWSQDISGYTGVPGDLSRTSPVSRRCLLATIFGSKLESQSRGTESSTGPVSVINVFAR